MTALRSRVEKVAGSWPTFVVGLVAGWLAVGITVGLIFSWQVLGISRDLQEEQTLDACVREIEGERQEARDEAYIALTEVLDALFGGADLPDIAAERARLVEANAAVAAFPPINDLVNERCAEQSS